MKNYFIIIIRFINKSTNKGKIFKTGATIYYISMSV